MLLRDKEKRRRLRLRAQAMASTGRYANWQDVESTLKRDGGQGAHEALDAPLVRFMLNIRCALARPSVERS